MIYRTDLNLGLIPQHIHECKACVFLGALPGRSADVWICEQTEESLIIRDGSGEQDYASFPMSILTATPLTHWAQALALAQAWIRQGRQSIESSMTFSVRAAPVEKTYFRLTVRKNGAEELKSLARFLRSSGYEVALDFVREVDGATVGAPEPQFF